MKIFIIVFLFLVSLSVFGQSDKRLYEQRYKVLMEDYYTKEFDIVLIEEILPEADSLINRGALYQCLFNESKTKFVAFFAEKPDGNIFKSSKDKNVNILASGAAALDSLNTYTYIVRGVKENDRWHYIKSEVTLFNSNTLEEGRRYFFNALQAWGFFKGKSTQYNSNFWESKLFSKVDNGQYEIVYLSKDEEQAKLNATFKEKIATEAFKPFYDNWKSKDKDDFIEYGIMYDKFTLIYPESKKVILNPLLVTNREDKQIIRYFVFIPEENKFYEWTFPKHKVRERKFWHYGSDVKDELSKLTNWNFNMKTLDDSTFWNNYVLLKEKGNYKFLKELPQ